VGHVQRGHAEAVHELGDLAAQPRPVGRVAVAERLVEQEHLGNPDGRARQRDALLLAG
jgi:hypothetical protein